MNTQQISFKELATLPKAAHYTTVFQATLSVIPDAGCRLFVNYERRCFDVIDDEGEPMFFPTVAFALEELAKLPGIDHQVKVDILSLLPRVTTPNRFFEGPEKVISRLLGQARPGDSLIAT